MTDITHPPASAASAVQAGLPAAPALPQSPAKGTQLDWSRVAPPKNLESARVEELSIDGICGVY